MKSKFTGGLFGMVGLYAVQAIVVIVTLGFGLPWAVCMKEKWYARHTIIDGYRLTFDGTGFQLFGQYTKWLVLTFLTGGIYGFWLAIKLKQWITQHTHLEIVI